MNQGAASPVAGGLNAAELREVHSLSGEKDPELFGQSLLAFGARLEQAGKVGQAAQAYGTILASPGHFSPELQKRAQGRLDNFLGKGPLGQRLEFLGSRFVDQTTSLKIILPMMAGTLVGELAATVALGRFAGASGSSPWLIRAAGTRFGARTMGFFAEASTFAVANRALSPTPNGPFSNDLARASLMIGAFRLFGFVGRRAEQRLTQHGVATPLRRVLAPGTAFLGLAASRKIEERLGLLPEGQGENFFLDTFYSLFTLGVGAYLGRRLMGDGLARFRSELGFRARQSEGAREGNGFGVFAGSFVPVNGFHGYRGTSLTGRNPPRAMMMMTGMGNGGSQGSGKKNTTLDPLEEKTEVGMPLMPTSGTIVQAVPLKPAHEPPPIPEETIETDELQVGDRIDGRFRIDGVIGEGGMGFVYRCTHEILGKTVAVKVLRPKHSANEEAIERFINEAKTASDIDHPHIIRFHDVGRLPDGANYIVMEYLEGMSLHDLVAGTPVPVSSILQIADQIAQGISAAHRAGIIHRDLKPENIFIVNSGEKKDFVKILDFGIAKMWTQNGKKLTAEGLVVGTPEYMSPEQALGGPVDHRSDIYSFGIILYEMATGGAPFVNADKGAVLRMQLAQEPTPFWKLDPQPQVIPTALEDIIFKAIAKKPEDRYPSMEQMIMDLNLLKADPTVSKALVRPTRLGIGPVSYHIPVNDFKSSAQGQVEPSLSRSRRLPLYGGIAALGITALIAAILAARESETKSSPIAAPGDASPPDAKPQPTITPIEPIPDKTPIRKKVALKLIPADARVFQGSKDLGTNPVIEIEEGAKLEVEIRRPGFETKKIQLDAAQEKQSIHLERKKKINGRPTPPKPKDKVKPDDKSYDLTDPFK